jgi:cadmium resistance protein CadD (predicted permease)
LVFINDRYLGIIGFVPILIGLNLLREQVTDSCSCCSKNSTIDSEGRYFEKVPNDTETDTESFYDPTEIGIDSRDLLPPHHRHDHDDDRGKGDEVTEQDEKKDDEECGKRGERGCEDEEEEEDEQRAIQEEYTHDLEESVIARTINSWFSHIFHYQALQAFVITLMNSGDNVAIYIPLFATASPTALIICFVTFYICVALLLFAAYHTARFKHVAEIFDQYGHWLVPVLLIGLGIFIVAQSGLFGGGFAV